MFLMQLGTVKDKASLGKLKAWSMVNDFPHGQCDRSLVSVHPNLRQRASLNACLWRLKLYFTRGMEVSHDKAHSRYLALWHVAGPRTAWASVALSLVASLHVVLM